MKINTTQLQSLVNKAIKGSSNNKLLPLTGLMGIELKNNVLTLETTDSTNYLFVNTEISDSSDFYVTIESERFTKLVNKITSEYIELNVVGDTNPKLSVKGNGEYTIEIPLDENGGIIKFPNPIENLQIVPNTKLTLDTISLMLSTAKANTAKTLERPELTGYYLSNKIFSGDGYKVCSIDIDVIDKPILLNPQMVDLLDVVSDDMQLYVSDRDVILFNNNVTIYGKTLYGIESYPSGVIENITNSELDNVCDVNRNELLKVLDRISLFVTPMDDSAIKVEFSDSGLYISSNMQSGREYIPYVTNNGCADFECNLDIILWQEQLKSQSTDVTTIEYGDNKVIKMTYDNVIQILVLKDN